MAYGSRSFQTTTPATLPSSANPASDQIGGVDYPAVKLIDPTADSTTPIGTAANPLKTSVTTSALPTGAATEASLATVAAQTTVAGTGIGAPADAAASSDTGGFSLISLVKRLLSKLTTQLPAALTTGGFFKVSLQEDATGSAFFSSIVNGRAAITDGSSTAVLAAAGSGIKNYVTLIVISNSSATDAEVNIRDGAAGTILMTIPAPANKKGAIVPLGDTPLPSSANTAICADPDAALSTITVSMVGFTAA
jgi:hypothetical protein